MPSILFTSEEIRAHEARLFATGHTPSDLMERAGAAAFQAMRHQWPDARRIGVLLGRGQNAGDGWVLVRLAREANLMVVVCGWGSAGAELTGAAAEMAGRVVQVGGLRRLPDAAALADEPLDVLVDAGFGLGFDPDRALSPEVARWMMAAQDCRLRGTQILALDIPSGLCADTGRGHLIIPADLTVTFLGLKIGLFTGQGAAVRGQVLRADLGVPVPDEMGTVSLLDAVPQLSPKPRAGHKGSFGTVLVVAGNRGMAGAARMAAEAALRSGAGKVLVATHPAHAEVLGVGCPELIVQGIAQPDELSPLLARAQAVVLGCGLGADDWAQGLISATWAAGVPLVVDADALSALPSLPRRDAATLLTPHPGEAARLLGCSTAAIEADRLAAARSLFTRWGAAGVLKGAGSVLWSAQGLKICGRGDPALATGGAGDVLAGVIGGLLAIGLTPDDALTRAVCWHAQAGELLAARAGSWGAVATDLLPEIRALINGRAAPKSTVWTSC
ncbi:NAD(P)H-hydrate dehydratase [Halothiobacillus sp. DCM-1]|uniref:NAD(P)H-hydrate dehydratase n=1 Tax=Halothiobacillus sp. DCM-1 TaxID=3112558 RepID=UPI0032514848